MSYEHWLVLPPKQYLNEAKPGLPLVELDSFVQPPLLPPTSVAAVTLALSTR